MKISRRKNEYLIISRRKREYLIISRRKKEYLIISRRNKVKRSVGEDRQYIMVCLREDGY